MNRVGDPKCAVTVPAGPPVGHAVTVAAHGAAGHAQPGAVDGNEVVDLAFHFRVEKVAHAAQVPRSFLTYIAHEIHRATSLQTGFFEGTSHGQHYGQAAAVIANAGT